MVKPEQQKKPPQKKQQNPQIKNKGKQNDTSQLRTQLDALGLRIVDVTADGNCFFRSLADQLEGNEGEHRKYRSMVVKHIFDNRETFEPFIEDEVPFEEYCLTMENDGTWAGHMELQAASLVTHTNICIHRSMFPRWYIRNFDDREARMVHLSYHDGQHYNSVRSKDDPCDGPARSIVIQVDADLSAPSHQAGRETFQPGSVKVVMAGNREKVEQILEQVNGDVSAAIEFLIAEQGSEECSSSSVCLTSQASSNGCHENENRHKNKENMVEGSTNDESNNNSRKTNDDITLLLDDKKIPRNKVCPCGSKKKCKACCGTASGKQSVKFVVNQAAESRKSKKEMKKGISANDSVIPDMGALFI